MSAPRPGQVTFLSWAAIVGSAMVIATGFEQVAGLRSLDTKESVREFLAEPPGSATGLSLTGALEVLRLSTMVSVACAGAILILGFWLLRGHRQARVAASILAVPLFASGFISGGLMSAVVAASVMMLWLTPAKHFFDGTTPPPLPTRGDRGREDADKKPAVWPPRRDDEAPSEVSAPPEAPRSLPQSDAPAADEPSPGRLAPYTTVAPPRPDEDADPGAAPGEAVGPAAAPGPAPWPASVPAAAPASAFAPTRPTTRPLSVVWACLLTWLGSLFVSFALLASIVMLGINPDAVMTEVLAQNPDISQEDLPTAVLAGVSMVMMAAMLLWAVAAGILAVFVMRGHEWARIMLLISAALVAVLSLAMALVAPPTLLLLAAAGFVFVMLLRPDSAAWTRTRRE